MGGGISRMAKQELLAAIRDRYQESSKKAKCRILDEFIAVTGHRRNMWPSLHLTDDAVLNRQGLEWCDAVANARVPWEMLAP